MSTRGKSVECVLVRVVVENHSSNSKYTGIEYARFADDLVILVDATYVSRRQNSSSATLGI
jgi:hypothetical protein